MSATSATPSLGESPRDILAARCRTVAETAERIASAYRRVALLLDSCTSLARRRRVLDLAAVRWRALLPELPAEWESPPYPPTTNPDTFTLYAEDYDALAGAYRETATALSTDAMTSGTRAFLRSVLRSLPRDVWRAIVRSTVVHGLAERLEARHDSARGRRAE
ncbi:hypothetical protein ACFQPA_13115 [Halomarina halobia]|uniref:Uncharacterized protein n=1 Tax=Halomarina halobia TaxID=3033386 RepID=A0ABD6A9V2_9EURY|nr:hypothetical protein [Halomarina sp. PSR21]